MNSYSELLDYIVSLDSKYQEVWDSEDNYHRNDDGDSTMCGVLAAFGQYLQNHQNLMSLPYLESLFQFIEIEEPMGSSLAPCPDISEEPTGLSLAPRPIIRAIFR
jgi:hypothetical protein